MRTVRLSARGQVRLPKEILASRGWGASTEFVVEETEVGVLLRAVERFPETELDDVAGWVRSDGPAKTIGEMDEGIRREVTRRHDRGRY